MFEGSTHPRDASPDFHACMLHLALAPRYSTAKLPFKAEQEYQKYISKQGHVSAGCRIGLRDEISLCEHLGE